jgi:hypothetical protein
MGNVPTPAQLNVLRRYLLESDGRVPFQHLHTMRQRLRDPSISGYELVECAKMLLLNDSDGEEGKDEDINPDWLSRINLDLMRGDS